MTAVESENRSFLARPYLIAMGVVLLASVGSTPLRSQDVAEAARQARQRKSAKQNSYHHVYTEDDLKRTKILTPEDASRAVASQKVPATPDKSQSETAMTEQEPETLSLGEVARRYRKEKKAREAEQTTKALQPSRYPLDLPRASLAAPRVVVGPPSGSLTIDELPPVHRRVPATGGAGSWRMSPFAPRRGMVSAAPVVSAPLVTMVATLQRKQVQPGESWWRLAQRYLGGGSRWVELLRVNPGVSRDPKRLKAGTFVFVPQRPVSGIEPPGPQIVVQQGDTLWSLALEHLGCGGAWPKLAAANPEITNFPHLQIGTKLKLPEHSGELCPAPVLAASRK